MLSAVCEAFHVLKCYNDKTLTFQNVLYSKIMSKDTLCGAKPLLSTYSITVSKWERQ